MFEYLHCKNKPYIVADESLVEKYGIKFNMDHYFECDSIVYLEGWVYSSTHQIQCVYFKSRKWMFVNRQQLQYTLQRWDVFENCGVKNSQKSGFVGCYKRRGRENLQLGVLLDNGKEVALFEITSCDVKSEALRVKEEAINYLCDVYPNECCKKKIKLMVEKLRHLRKLQVFFNHDLGGGADSYLKNKIEEEEIKEYAIVKYNLYCKRYALELHYSNEVCCLSFWRLDNVISLLEKAHIFEIWINNLYTYPDIYSVQKKLMALKEKKRAKLIYPVHDYYEISPEKNLLSIDGVFRGTDDTNISNIPSYEKEEINISEWRQKWLEFLCACDEVRCFSLASKDLLESVYGMALKTSLVPHSMEYFEKIVCTKKITHHVYDGSENLHVGILGVLTEAKGLKIIKSMLNKIETENYPIDITLIGSASDSIQSSRFCQTGTYDIENLPEIAEKYKIDIFFIPSVWPETFSYTTGEVMAMGYPVIVFDMGAPAERVRKYRKGYVVKEVSAEAVCDVLLNDVIR